VLRRLARPGPLAAVVALVAAIAGNMLEEGVVRLVGPRLRVLEYISDEVLALALGAAAYLWLHLRETRSSLSRLERERLVLDTELTVAADIQRRLLPPVPAPRGGYVFAARLEPAGRVGGDFYDFVEAGSGVVFAMLADVAGKGIPAALVHGECRTLFRLLLRRHGQPALLAEHISRALHEQYDGLPYVGALIACFDLQRHEVTVVNAGLPAGLLFSSGTTRRLTQGGPPLGLLPGATYEGELIALRGGDIGCFVTDGISEALEGDSRSYDSVAADLARERHAESLCDRLVERARAGLGPAGAGDWQDDRTVLAFARNG